MERKLQYIRNAAVEKPRPGLLLQAALVTACDSKSLEMSKGTIESLQRHFPSKTIHVYGLGLEEDEVQEVKYYFVCVISKLKKYIKGANYFLIFLAIQKKRYSHDGIYYIFINSTCVVLPKRIKCYSK